MPARRRSDPAPESSARPNSGRGRPILVHNARSSTLNASLVRPGTDETAASTTERWQTGVDGGPDVDSTLERVLDAVGLAESTADLAGVGHRVVHGGEEFRAPVVLDDPTVEAIDRLGSLAPLHNPVAVATIRSARTRLGSVPHVACFDTAFHATLPETATRYPVPGEWSGWGIRRFGFHGLSVEWSVGRSAELLDRPARRVRLVVAHLGAGCSVTAIDRGRSVWTSMGLTPLEGPMMATRSGSIDPGIIIRLLRERRLSLDELDEVLERGSGLLAVGGAADMRQLLAAEADGDAAARLAVAMFVDRVAASIAAAATRLRDVDALVFTGGIGENAASIRSGICRSLRVLGVPPVAARNVGRDSILARPARATAVLRIAAREDVVIARAVETLAGGGQPAARVARD
jgi:acetate kinase